MPSSLLFDPDTGRLIHNAGQLMLTDFADCCCGDDPPPRDCFGYTGFGEPLGILISEYTNPSEMFTGKAVRNDRQVPECHRLLIGVDWERQEQYIQCEYEGGDAWQCDRARTERLNVVNGSLRTSIANVLADWDRDSEWGLWNFEPVIDDINRLYGHHLCYPPQVVWKHEGTTYRMNEIDPPGINSTRWCPVDNFVYENTDPTWTPLRDDPNGVQTTLAVPSTNPLVAKEKFLDFIAGVARYLNENDINPPSCPDDGTAFQYHHEWDTYTRAIGGMDDLLTIWGYSESNFDGQSWDFERVRSSQTLRYKGSIEYLGEKGACGLLINSRIEVDDDLVIYEADGSRFGASDSFRTNVITEEMTIRIETKGNPTIQFTTCDQDVCGQDYQVLFGDAPLLTDIACTKRCRGLGDMGTFFFFEKNAEDFERRQWGFGGRDDSSSDGKNGLGGAGDFL